MRNFGITSVLLTAALVVFAVPGCSDDSGSDNAGGNNAGGGAGDGGSNAGGGAGDGGSNAGGGAGDGGSNAGGGTGAGGAAPISEIRAACSTKCLAVRNADCTPTDMANCVAKCVQDHALIESNTGCGRQNLRLNQCYMGKTLRCEGTIASFQGEDCHNEVDAFGTCIYSAFLPEECDAYCDHLEQKACDSLGDLFGTSCAMDCKGYSRNAIFKREGCLSKWKDYLTCATGATVKCEGGAGGSVARVEGCAAQRNAAAACIDKNTEQLP